MGGRPRGVPASAGGVLCLAPDGPALADADHIDQRIAAPRDEPAAAAVARQAEGGDLHQPIARALLGFTS